MFTVDGLVHLHGILVEVNRKLNRHLGQRGLTIRTEKKIVERWAKLFQDAKTSLGYSDNQIRHADIDQGKFALKELLQLKKVEFVLKRSYAEDVDQMNAELRDEGVKRCVELYNSMRRRMREGTIDARVAAYLLSRQFKVVSSALMLPSVVLFQ